MEYFLLTSKQRKRKRAFFYESLLEETASWHDEDHDFELLTNVASAAGILGSKPRQPRGADRDRSLRQLRWEELYRTSSEEEFKEKMRVSRSTFENILHYLWYDLERTPTNWKPNPTTPDRQLALTLYRLAHGVSYIVLDDIFGVSKETACMFFNKVVRLIVAYFYDEYVKMPETDKEWEAEVRGFLENYGFPTVGAWDGFHVHVESQLKSNFSFKKKYTVNNLALTTYNKRFLYAAVGAPGSTHDARMLKESSFFDEVLNGRVLPDRKINLGDFGDIPLVTIGDSAFPRFSWLVKCYNENTRDQQQRYFNKMLCSARVVSENTYGMLKGRWRFLYKKTEARPENLRYIIMACIALHNVCIAENDPCQPRWQLEVQHLDLIRGSLVRQENKVKSNLNRMKISNWLWMDH
jgi:hypothetical protein